MAHSRNCIFFWRCLDKTRAAQEAKLERLVRERGGGDHAGVLAAEVEGEHASVLHAEITEDLVHERLAVDHVLVVGVDQVEVADDRGAEGPRRAAAGFHPPAQHGVHSERGRRAGDQCRG